MKFIRAICRFIYILIILTVKSFCTDQDSTSKTALKSDSTTKLYSSNTHFTIGFEVLGISKTLGSYSVEIRPIQFMNVRAIYSSFSAKKDVLKGIDRERMLSYGLCISGLYHVEHSMYLECGVGYVQDEISNHGFPTLCFALCYIPPNIGLTGRVGFYPALRGEYAFSYNPLIWLVSFGCSAGIAF
jgi:hypothetical protein